MSGETGTYKPTEHGGKKQDGSPDKRVSSEHGFGGDREKASEMGKVGGKSSGSTGEEQDETYEESA